MSLDKASWQRLELLEHPSYNVGLKTVLYFMAIWYINSNKQKRNPIRGAAIVEKLEYINKQNSVVNNIRFNYLLLFSGKKK